MGFTCTSDSCFFESAVAGYKEEEEEPSIVQVLLVIIHQLKKARVNPKRVANTATIATAEEGQSSSSEDEQEEQEAAVQVVAGASRAPPIFHRSATPKAVTESCCVFASEPSKSGGRWKAKHAVSRGPFPHVLRICRIID
jgi:hypothetical protein